MLIFTCTYVMSDAEGIKHRASYLKSQCFASKTT